jgi:hypothetical protein
LEPAVNIQIGAPGLRTRNIPGALVRDVVVVVPSIEADSVELVGAAIDGGWMMQRTRRNGADLAVHSARVRKFFAGHESLSASMRFAPIVFSWLAGRGARATRVDPQSVQSTRELHAQLRSLLSDDRLFIERLVIYS